MTPTLRQQYLGMRIVHGGLLAPLAIYGALAFAIVRPQPHPLDPRLLCAIFGAISLALVAIVVPLVRKKMLPELRDSGTPLDLAQPIPPTSVKSLNSLRAASILTWALCESTAMFGLVVAFITGEPRYYPPFAAFALIAMVIYRPTRALFDSVIRASS